MNRRRRPAHSGKNQAKPRTAIQQPKTESPGSGIKWLLAIPFLVVILIAPTAIFFRLPLIALVSCGISIVVSIALKGHRNWVPMLVWAIVLFLFALRMQLET